MNNLTQSKKIVAEVLGGIAPYITVTDVSGFAGVLNSIQQVIANLLPGESRDLRVQELRDLLQHIELGADFTRKDIVRVAHGTMRKKTYGGAMRSLKHKGEVESVQAGRRPSHPDGYKQAIYRRLK